MQSYLIDNLENNFGEEGSRMHSFITPGTPCFKIVRPAKELEVIDANLQSRFRSGVVMLLYSTNYSR
jgi:hypothetical protein